MKKKRVAVFTGGRFEYGILRPVIAAISESKSLDLQLIVSGVHFLKKYGSTIDQIKRDGFSIDAKVNIVVDKEIEGKVSLEIGNGIQEFTKILLKLKPDLVVLNGDRSEALACAVSAAFIPIPIAHIHGGDLSKAGFDESIRHAITKLAHFHFPATKKSMNRILRMGENPKNVFLVGAPGLDELMNEPVISKSELSKKLGVKIGNNLIIVLQHPVSTSPTTAKREIRETLKAISNIKCTRILIYPNGDPGSNAIVNELEKLRSKKDYLVLRNVNRRIYANILRIANVLVGNSSSGIIEASSFGLPVVNVGTRQEGRERNNNVVNIDYNALRIETAISKIIKSKIRFKKGNIYGNGHSGKKIAKILEKINFQLDLIQKHFYEKN